jgi:hypothetical protein
MTCEHIHAFFDPLACGLQHGVGFAHAGTHAEEDEEPAPFRLSLLALHFYEQSIWIRAIVVVHGIGVLVAGFETFVPHSGLRELPLVLLIVTDFHRGGPEFL